MAKERKMGRPKDFPDQETEKVAGYVPKDTARRFKAFVQLSDAYPSISTALNAALLEFMEKQENKRDI